MADLASVDAYLEDEDPGTVALFRRFQELVEQCGPSQSAPRSSIVYWKRSRIFAGAFVKSRRLELLVDLRRDAGHPRAIAAFPTTKTVVTNRLRITNADQLDDSIAALLREAYETVGPGTRSASHA